MGENRRLRQSPGANAKSGIGDWVETVPRMTPHPAADRRLAFKDAVEQSEETLREAVHEALRGGATEADLLADLEAIRNGLSEGVEDRVLDVMDLLIGWCGPHARLSRDDL
jgi:hypothetical protein